MARTIAEIQAEIIAAKEAESALNGLTSTSRTAIWRLWTWIVATAIQIHEQLWDIMKVELEELAEQAVVNTPKWFVGRALDYQDGYPLRITQDFKLVYDTVDEAAKIIKYASASTVGNIGVVKVARDVNCSPAPLSSAELERFKGYLNDIAPPGVAITAESRASDILTCNVSIYYDANVNEADTRAAVVAAINAYINNLDFDGVVYASRLVDAIQAVPNVIDVFVTSFSGQELGGAAATQFSRIYQTVAGHIQFDEINSIINMIGQ